MRQPEKAELALDRARSLGKDPILRSLWLAKAADYAIKDRAVLVGGAAVNLHTGSYRPTDVDMCALLDASDRQALVELGFANAQGDHFEYRFDDGETWLLEFPGSQVDGDVSMIQLSAGDTLTVIRLESLIVDRLLQATDRTSVTFEEAVRLCLAAFEKTDWSWVSAEIGRRDTLEPGLGVSDVYDQALHEVRSLLDPLGQS
ncbi:MAG TPA: hypothetical protein VI980_07800 [Acidimicrobiia bacterium]|nr:hypothetical protein [Acidimicrobiia bacterium]